ncbi:2-(1,2-epoxy-1,2-dihydrophenyl)acetyl-CoA isomerase [Geodermatophilus pulveris]|uniref:2-(1,2-epoxy-1,2-dihydrophenyl)acetyl-CoA isomerase n=1 Tax=Geodermatophilus pulveris TaxID=1564159 RepID=A0A239GZ53_9ACTN|nr:enoyl-CoA hydratase-related protein [Geodermatophilus pulveris]SNS74078.1 2-(1,2-epoxy-1,2-dihydrophenyl)acetyl-CoA isomerase [Geodermatophilus pulveris]
MTDRPVRTDLDGDVWRVTLAAPDTGNALDPAMAAALAGALGARPPRARAVLLLADGPRFCVGGDVRGFAAAADPGAEVGRLATDWHVVVRALLDSPVPVVAGVHGAVAGAGVGLLGAVDVVVCARSTRIRPAYAAIGFSPDGGSTWTLAHALGPARALDLVLTDGTLDAEEARACGLVARVVADDDLRESAGALAHALAAGPVRALVRTRALIRGAAARTPAEQLDHEARLIAESAADPEGREGVRAFVEKRRPDFRAAR